jgi:hypothetical protein
MKVIISGSRSFEDYELLKKENKAFLEGLEEVEIVSGVAMGADMLGIKYAREMNYGIKKFPANWERHGRSAGIKRNYEMACYANALICFWDGKSRGTANMIEVARKRGLTVKVVMF